MQLEHRDKIKNDLVDKSKQALTFFCKLCMWKQKRYIDRWKQEVWSSLHDVPGVIGTGKEPSVEFILDAITTTSVDELILAAADYDEEKIPKKLDRKSVAKKVEMYSTWLALKLSTIGFVGSEATYEVVDMFVG